MSRTCLLCGRYLKLQRDGLIKAQADEQHDLELRIANETAAGEKVGLPLLPPQPSVSPPPRHAPYTLPMQPPGCQGGMSILLLMC